MRSILTLLAVSVLCLGAVDINSADKNTLMGIKGVGEKKAEAVLEYRAKNGCFKSVDEIKKVKGFGEKFLSNNRGDLTADNCAK